MLFNNNKSQKCSKSSRKRDQQISAVRQYISAMLFKKHVICEMVPNQPFPILYSRGYVSILASLHFDLQLDIPNSLYAVSVLCSFVDVALWCVRASSCLMSELPFIRFNSVEWWSNPDPSLTRLRVQTAVAARRRSLSPTLWQRKQRYVSISSVRNTGYIQLHRINEMQDFYYSVGTSL